MINRIAYFSDTLSKEKILAAGDMIKRVYIDCVREYQTLYENPILFPRAPQQVFVETFDERDTSKASIKQQDQQSQYEAEVDFYRALESLELNKKIIVLHNFKYSKSQACLFSGSEESSAGEHDFVVIVRDYVIIIFEVKSPKAITDKTFKRNLSDARKQLRRAKNIITNICNIWNIDQSAFFVREYAVFPKTSKTDLRNFNNYKTNKVSDIIFQNDVENFRCWWEENIKSYLVEVSIVRSIRSNDVHRLKSTLLGIWCVNEQNLCDIEICSLGHCVKEVDDAVRSAEITQTKLKPLSKGVKTSPTLFRTYFGVDCLTETQKIVYNDDKVAQYIMGPAGSGKTLLLLGKMIQVFQRQEPNNSLKRKFVLITGSFDLDDIAEMLKKAGMKTSRSHRVLGGETHDLRKMRLQRNEEFYQDFHSTQSNFDAFILHHFALTDTTFWPQSKETEDSIKHGLLSVICNKDLNHIFIDDFHNAVDTIFSSITMKPPFMFIKDYSKTLMHEVITAMRRRYTRNSNDTDPPYLWLIYDHSQMTSCILKDDNFAIDSTRYRRMITYVRDFENALKDEMICDQNSSNTLFRSLTRNLRNTVDISRCIENVFKDHAKHCCLFNVPLEEMLDHLEISNIFQETGHLIHGPKPTFFLVKNSDYQEETVLAIVIDVLEELLKDNKIRQSDIAIITDSFGHLLSSTGKKVMDKLFSLKCYGFGGVTVRVTEDKDTIQATEWKAVIHITDLIEFKESILPSEPRYLTDIPPIMKCNLPSTDAYKNAKSIFETHIKLACSPIYVVMSRARVYHVVIGKVGNFERRKYWEVSSFFHKKYGYPLPSQSEIDKYRCLPNNGSVTLLVNEEGEYAFYKKKNFVYKTVPDCQEHAFLPRQYYTTI